MMLKTIILWFALSMTISFAHAGAFEDGMAAFEAAEYKEAVEILRPLAEQGEVNAQIQMGNMYASGFGVKQDNKEALKLYHQAAEQGSVEAEYLLGAMYGIPRPGLIPNYEEALKWYLSAAEQGHADAQYSVGAVYFKGEGVPTDYVMGYAWMDVASQNGSEDADEYREMIGSVLSPEDLAEGKALAEELFEKYGQEKKQAP